MGLFGPHVMSREMGSLQLSLRNLAVFKRGNRDNKPQSREEPGRETTEKEKLALEK